jgi:hypothetical protein
MVLATGQQRFLIVTKKIVTRKTGQTTTEKVLYRRPQLSQLSVENVNSEYDDDESVVASRRRSAVSMAAINAARCQSYKKILRLWDERSSLFCPAVNICG